MLLQKIPSNPKPGMPPFFPLAPTHVGERVG